MTRTAEAAGRWLDENLYRFDGPGQFLGDEPGSQLASFGGNRAALWDYGTARVLMAASWDYAQASGNIAIPAVLNAIRLAGEYVADRFYLPKTPRDWSMLCKGGLGVFGIETRHPLRDFDVVATSISYTVLFQNFSAYLTASGVPLRRADREKNPGAWPMVMAGGQAYCAPEFMSAVFDCIWLGEAEDEEGESGGIGEVCAVIAGMKADGSWQDDRAGCYRTLARRFTHLYFPRFTAFSYRYEDRGLEHPVKMVAGHWPVLDGMRYPHQRRYIKNLDKMAPLCSAPLLYTDPGMGAGDSEIARGCTCWCPFCRLSWVTKPYRQHDVDYSIRQMRLWRQAMGSVDISLVAPDPPVHTQMKELLARILGEVTDEVDASSMRIDDYLADHDFALLMSVAGADSLTLGLEGNSQRMRDLAGKGTSDDDVCEVVTRAIRARIKRIKLYMITNWPGETAADVMRIVELGRRLADIRDSFGEAGRSVRIQFSWTPLLIEAQTPLQWFEVTAPDYRLQQALDQLRDLGISMKIGAKANPAKLAFFQACQRASRDAGEALADVVEGIGEPSWGGFPKDMQDRLDAALVAHGFRNGLADLFGERFRGDLLGWEHIDTGVSTDLMWQVYADMVAFLKGTDPETYDNADRGEARGNEWVGRCLAEGTEVRLKDGSVARIEDLAGREADVLAGDLAGSAVNARAHSVWEVGDRDDVVEVEFEDGSIVRLTADHKVMLDDGSYVQAGQLAPEHEVATVRGPVADRSAFPGWETMDLDFWENVVIGPVPERWGSATGIEFDGSPCLLWDGEVDEDGYGFWRVRSVGRLAVIAYAWVCVNGPVPPDKVLNHMCHVKRCIRHIEACSVGQNTQQVCWQEASERYYAKKAEIEGRRRRKNGQPGCRNGHEYTGQNTRWRERNGKKYRVCKDCEQDQEDLRRLRRQAGELVWSGGRYVKAQVAG